MAKKCIYCKDGIADGRSIDVCDKCGVGVWGAKMFNTIKKNMEDANKKGDLCLNHETSNSDELKKFGV